MVQSLLQQQVEYECHLVDPIDNIDPHLSLIGIARPRIDGKCGPNKELNMVSKCDVNNIRRGLIQLATARMYDILVASITFYKFPLAGNHFNFLVVRVGSSENIIPNELILILKAITKEIREALKGTLRAVLFLEKECSTNQALSGHLRVAQQMYYKLLSTVLLESNMAMYHKNSCFQLYMRDRELLGHGDESSGTLVSNSEKGVTIKTSWENMMHTNASNNIINATEQISLDTTLFEGAETFHQDTAVELLFHLRNVRSCNDSIDPL